MWRSTTRVTQQIYTWRGNTAVNAPSCHDHYQYHSQLNACPSTLHEQMGLSPQVNMNEASIIFSERTHKSGHASSHSSIYKKCSMVSNEKYVKTYLPLGEQNEIDHPRKKQTHKLGLLCVAIQSGSIFCQKTNKNCSHEDTLRKFSPIATSLLPIELGVVNNPPNHIVMWLHRPHAFVAKLTETIQSSVAEENLSNRASELFWRWVWENWIICWCKPILHKNWSNLEWSSSILALFGLKKGVPWPNWFTNEDSFFTI